jgi:uncharacterized membrane protein YkvA (DUF1232 family)
VRKNLAWQGLKTVMAQAERFARDPAAVSRIAEEAVAKLRANAAQLVTVKDDLITLARLVTAMARGAYRELPWTSLVMVVAALMYFVNPLDMVPDFIIGAGLVDDVAVIAFVLNALRGDLDSFRAWEAGAGAKAAADSTATPGSQDGSA